MRNKNKIILINPPIFFSKGAPRSLDSSVPPLGLMYLASYINKYSKEFRASVVDVSAENLLLGEIVNKIGKEKPFIVGISAMTPQLQGAVELAKTIKEMSGNNIKIFLGGPHVSADPDFINRFFDIFDYTIAGEAERTFLESSEKLLAHKKIPKIQAGQAVLDLDSIPFPNRKLIKRGKYNRRESMMFSRGCPYDCYYCSRPSISKWVRYRSVDNLISEIKLIVNDCRGEIDFQDDTFTLDKDKVLVLCREICKQKLKLRWSCNTRVDLVNREILAEMKKAGCKLIHFGIESGNENIRKETIKKGNFTNDEIYKVFSLCQELKIKIGGYFMIGHPGETKKELKETEELIKKSKIDLLGLSIPTPFPGSQLYEIAKKENIINENIIDKFSRKELGEGYSGNYPVFVPKGVSKNYLYSFMKRINREFYLTPRVFINRFFHDLFSFKDIKKDAENFFSLVLKGVSKQKPYLKNKK